MPLLGKDQTLVAVTAAQPVTPLFKLHEVVNIARADERVAMAKAGMPVETASNVEKAYYGLLVAQRQLAIAKAKADGLRDRRLVASNGAPPSAMPVNEEQEIGSAKDLVIANSKVKEMTVSLNELLGYPEETELELVAPVTQVEEISLKEAADKAMAANPEVVEAESNVAKAHAASKLSKLDYVPDVAIIGGYTYNDNLAPLLPRDFSFIGIMGSYNLFDFGKREHTIKERNAQVSMAETALELTKAKVAAAVKTSYFQMDRSRQLSALAHRLSDAIPVERISYAKGDSDLAVSRAKVEVEMFQADLEYRQSLAQLKTLMGEELSPSSAGGGLRRLSACLRLPEPYCVAFDVGKPGEGAVRNFYGRHDCLSAGGFHLLERCGDIIGLDVEVRELVRLMSERGDVSLDARR